MNDFPPHSRFDLRQRTGLLNAAGVFEGGLALLALFFGWLAGVDPLRDFGVGWQAILWGLPAAGGMLLLLFAMERLSIQELRRIKELLLEFLGRPLAECRWYELILLAGLVGYSEELLFRGFLQPWCERSMSKTAALVVSNVLFGLLHAVTPLYFVLAGLIGAFHGWLLDASGERRLLAPILAHATYDYVAFLWIAREYRRQREAGETVHPE